MLPAQNTTVVLYCLLVYHYHSYPKGLKPSASNFSTSPGVGGGGGGTGSVRITCSSSLNIRSVYFGQL
jgi:hypothetical protein